MKRAMRDQIREPAASHPSCTAASLRHLLATLPPQFAGEAEHTLTASVELIATVRERKPWSRPPLSMNFQVGWAAHLLRPVFFQFVSIPAGVPAAAHELPGDGLVCVGGCVARLLQPVSNSRQLLPASILLPRCWAASATQAHRVGAVNWVRSNLESAVQVPMHSASGVRVQYLKVWEKVRRRGAGIAGRAWLARLLGLQGASSARLHALPGAVSFPYILLVPCPQDTHPLL